MIQRGTNPARPKRKLLDLGAAFNRANGLGPTGPLQLAANQGAVQGLEAYRSNPALGGLVQKKLAHEAASQPWDGGSVFSGISDYSGVMRRR